MKRGGSKAVPVGGGGAFVVAGRHGWLLWYLDDGLDVRVQVADVDAALLPTAVVVRSRLGGAVKGTHLRKIHLGQLERALQREDVMKMVRDAWWARGGPDFRPDSSTPDQAALLAATTPVEDDRARYVAERQTGARRRSDAFYFLVASQYLEASGNSRNPAGKIAELYGVPATTVHRWLKESKRRKRLRDETSDAMTQGELARYDLERGLRDLGLSSDEYEDLYGHEGSEDPLGMWK